MRVHDEQTAIDLLHGHGDTLGDWRSILMRRKKVNQGITRKDLAFALFCCDLQPSDMEFSHALRALDPDSPESVKTDSCMSDVFKLRSIEVLKRLEEI